MGFKGSGGRYSLPSEDDWAVLGMQKWSPGFSDETNFTVSAVVANKAAWGAEKPPNPTVDYSLSRPAPFARIGELVPAGSDKWWGLTPAVDLDILAEEILDDVRVFGLPWLLEQFVRHGCPAS